MPNWTSCPLNRREFIVGTVNLANHLGEAGEARKHTGEPNHLQLHSKDIHSCNHRQVHHLSLLPNKLLFAVDRNH